VLTRDEILALDRAHVWRPYASHEDHAERDPIVVREAIGPYLIDVDGRRYIDGAGSWWANALGHRHPRIVRVIEEQAARLLHAPLADATHEEAARCAEALVGIAPPGLTRVFFSDDGSTAVEVAIKIAHQYWQQNGRPARDRFVVLGGAFHGDTLGAVSVGGVEVFRRVFAPLLFDVLRAPEASDDAGWDRATEAVEGLLKSEGDRIAGVLVEPLLQGAAGMRMWRPELLARLREATTAADTFLLCDEVFTGFGRTGRMWASDHAGVAPDLLVTAKGLSGTALPFAATLGTPRIYEGFRGGKGRAFLHGHTFAGNPLGARVASEVIAIFREEGVLEGIPERAALIEKAFRTLPGVSAPRALGMVGAAELTAAEGGGADEVAAGYLGELGRAVTDCARHKGAYLRPLGDTVYVTPPLNIPTADLARLLEILGESVAETRPRPRTNR
jgi:adenosylmethionine-8-amino-7-oxononanoate aminotransferase